MNVTPDSFSDGGNFLSQPDAIARTQALIDEGADVVEVGGESTRPGAKAVPVKEQLRRVLPVIEELRARNPDVRIAIDTVRSQVAAAAIRAGATIVNDVSALRLDPDMARVCAEARCTVVLMHSRGGVDEMASYSSADYPAGDVMGAIVPELALAVENAMSVGVAPEMIVLDPGIGFSKLGEHSLRTLAQLPRLVDLGFPVMVGASRKRFIGEITGVKRAAERDAGTLGAHVVALTLGASWFRAHDVRAHRHALDVAVAVLEAGSERLPERGA